MYVNREYRQELSTDLQTFEIKIKETDLLISTKPGSVNDSVREKIYQHTFILRSELEEYIKIDPEFRRTLCPHLVNPDAPQIAREMACLWIDRRSSDHWCSRVHAAYCTLVNNVVSWIRAGAG
jgi:hypothetical protein